MRGHSEYREILALGFLQEELIAALES
jgi:hypothetical protein